MTQYVYFSICTLYFSIREEWTTNICLTKLKMNLPNECEVNDQIRNRARQAVGRSLTLSTPVRRLYERYRVENDNKRQEFFDNWRLRFLNRAKNDP